MSPRSLQTLAALTLQVTALVVLSLALLGVPWLDARTKPRVLVLVDRSLSMPGPATDAAVATVTRAAKAAGGVDLRLLEFAGLPGAPAARLRDSVAALQPAATNIELAMDAALAAHAQAGYSGAVVISDGLANAGDTERALRAAREARLPVQWIAVGRPAPDTRIVDVRAPQRATAGQPVRLTVQLAGQVDRALRVTVTARDASGETQAASAKPDGEGQANLELDVSGNGAVVVDVALDDPLSGQRLDARSNAVAIDIVARAAILYVQGSAGPLAPSLRAGGWTLNVVPATRADAYADRLDGYQAVVLDDVAISDATARFWGSLVAAVQERGLGLMVLGGERSFTRGGYRESALESVLPVLSEPAALDQSASVVFVVDKSGSMGQGIGVDRFRLAQRAVRETARTLTERDSLGLVVFDVEPRVLVPLGPAAIATASVERDWQASPGGGTRLAPALEVAMGELERSDAARRMLVVVTDGFIDNASLAEVHARLDRSRIETIALAVGPDADVTALARLVGQDAGSVVRVNEAAELPLAMRSTIERHRVRIDRGTIAVKQHKPLPFPPGDLSDWPPVAAYAVTRSRPNALVAVQTQRGDPLLAFHTSGQGRVAALTCGLGRWTPQWMRWQEWPRLAGGLTDWISGTSRDGMLALAVLDLPAAVQVDADVRGPMGWTAGPEDVSMAVKTPTGQARAVPADYVASGRLQATLPEEGTGLYTFVVSTALGTQRVLHLRSNPPELETWGISPALEAWKSAGLVRSWDPGALARRRDDTRPDRWLVALALLLFLAGVVVDRTKARPARP